jgi:siroheme synthase (precorrin-2 oxidase/ferrochelatase)
LLGTKGYVVVVVGGGKTVSVRQLQKLKANATCSQSDPN